MPIKAKYYKRNNKKAIEFLYAYIHDIDVINIK